GIIHKIFNYKAMLTDKWTEFSDLLSHNLSLHNTPLNSNTNESIETTWHKIEHSIINTAIHSIPNKKTCKQSYNHQYTSHSTLLYTSLKELGHLIKIVKNTYNNLNTNKINSQIQNINNRSYCNLQALNSDDHSQINTWIQHAQDIWKQLYQARHTENSLLLRQQIQQATEKRCETLSTHPKQAINSILNRYNAPIHFSNIKLPDQLITNPKLIKQHIQLHFHDWTAYRPTDQVLFDSFWHTYYQPQPHINTQWYNSLNSPITEEEVLQILSKLPNGKACGPTGISYEILKHVGTTCIKAITALFNRCFNSSQIPKQWKHSRIYPIPKRNIFNGDLNLTRPISLIKHIRKVYTKIITTRISTVFSQHPILSLYNYVTLPNNSTSIPIHILNNFIEDASCNHKPIWLLSQDMSKAYDSVNLTLLQKSLQCLSLPHFIINAIINILHDRQNQVITNL